MATLLVAGTAAHAGSWNGYVAATTDYVYRGLSQTAGHVALQGDIHYETPAGTYFGAWASTIRPAPGMDTSLEVDVYAGHAWQLSADWRARMTAIHYGYVDSPWQGPRDYDEIDGTLAFRDRLFLSATWSPNTSRYSPIDRDTRRTSASYEIAARQPLSRDWHLAAGMGYYDFIGWPAASYWYWNAGAGLTRGHFSADASVFGQDAPRAGFAYGSSQRARGAVTLTWRF